jgi:hypothetical protein
MTPSDKWQLLAAVRAATASDPEFVAEVFTAATAGQRDALEASNARRAELERAWVTALLILNANRLTPGLKSTLARSLLPVLTRYDLNRECQAVRDAYELCSDLAKVTGEAS